jgi:hypothetical protein
VLLVGSDNQCKRNQNFAEWKMSDVVEGESSNMEGVTTPSMGYVNPLDTHHCPVQIRYQAKPGLLKDFLRERHPWDRCQRSDGKATSRLNLSFRSARSHLRAYNWISFRWIKVLGRHQLAWAAAGPVRASDDEWPRAVITCYILFPDFLLYRIHHKQGK